jgi:hypothetical protein
MCSALLCMLSNAARDRQEPESHHAAAGGVNRRQRANLTPSAPERISTHG